MSQKTNDQRRNQRLQQKLLNEGLEPATDSEVLELVLGISGSARCSTEPIARALLEHFRTFGGVVCAPAGELLVVDGVDVGVATALKAIGAAACHMLRKSVSNTPVFKTNDALKDYLVAKLQHEKVEVFHILYVNGMNRLIADEQMWRGTINAVAVYPREVIGRCLKLGAASFIIAHNHPTGDLQPSMLDLRITEELCKAAALFGIHVLDHVIVGNGETLSFWTEGLMAKCQSSSFKISSYT